MQKHRDLTLQRLEKYKAVLRAHFYDQSAPLSMSVYPAPGRISFDEADQGDYQPLALHHRFAPLWSTHWVRVDYALSEDWRGREVHLRWDSSSEATVWREGEPVRGLSGTGPYWHSPYHSRLILSESASGHDQGRIYIEVAVNTPFGQMDKGPTSELGFLRLAELATFRREVWDLYWDFVVVADLAAELPADHPRAGRALAVANAMINHFHPDEPERINAARAEAATFLSEGGGTGGHEVYAIGHAHIDTAWLWPVAETRRKCVRSFSTAIRLMDRYPDYKFVCSQAQQLAWVKEDHPQLYERIRARVAEGRFVLVGGAWVEPDCNLPSGESLVRQFLYGQRFFQAEFGATHDNFWLPDTFGYSAALPQIMQGVGIRYFLTQKLSWNQFNKLPANTFYWEGLDGSRVLTHFPPADTYNGLGNVREIVEGTARFRDHAYSDASLYLFGFGDGGGGPSAEMLEQIARMGDVNGLPTVQQDTPTAFFEHVETTSPSLTTWVGELYFEAHRGTYTTQSHTKRANRKAQVALHDVEFLSVLTGVDHRDELTSIWQRLLLNQFHDILPGSSIREVYDDAERDYDWILSSLTAICDDLTERLFPKDESSHDLVVLNTLAHPRVAVVSVPPGADTPQNDADGKALALVEAPSLGYRRQAAGRVPDTSVVLTETDTDYTLENEGLLVRVGVDGLLLQVFDKRHQREALSGLGNQFVLYEDRPIDWDAWDIDAFALEKPNLVGGAYRAEVVERGPLRVAVRFAYRFGASHITQTIRLTAVSHVLEFDTVVDWHESHQLLKAEFPLAVRAPNALYETQFGYVERPTHRNTSWDLARFEVCAQRWAALREYGFGVALLNDGKHGYSTLGDRMALSLLRAPGYPDPDADRGQHTFRYGLMTFDGALPVVVRTAAAFEHPLHIHRASKDTPDSYSAFRLDCEHVVIDTVKYAEDNDTVILRVYEACGGRGTVTLHSARALSSACHCDLLEREGEAATVTGQHTLQIEIQPFQIVTLKLKLGDRTDD